jgi:hypothetical protein
MRQEQSAGRAFDQGVILAGLLDNIAKGKFKPFFERDEANALVRTEVLNQYSGGSYSDWKKLAAIPDWNDLLNSTFFNIVTNLSAAKVSPEFPLDQDIVLAFQMGHRQLKLIEDWIYYNKDVQTAIRTAISAFTNRKI